MHLSRIPRRLVAAALAALPVSASCNNPVDAVDPVVRIETALAWSGSQVVLTSPNLTGADTLPLVVIGADTVPARYLAPDSLVAAAPDTQGRFDVWLGFRGRALFPVGSVQLKGGFSGWQSIGSIGGYPLPWPAIGRGTFLSAHSTGLALVYPMTGSTTTQLPTSVFDPACINGPGPASGGRIAVVGTGCSSAMAVRSDSPDVAPDTGPPMASGYRFAAQLASGKWLVAYHHGVRNLTRIAGAWEEDTTVPYHLEEPYNVVVSPRGDRAVVLAFDGWGVGIPVFSPTSAAPAYLLRGFFALWGAQFSDDGDTLYVVGPPVAGQPPVLKALAASDGTVLRSAPAWSGTTNLALDPGRPWLYLVGHDAAYPRPPAVAVVDRATFDQVAYLVGDAGPLSGYLASDAYPMLDAVRRKLYLVDSCAFCSLGDVRIFAFDLIP